MAFFRLLFIQLLALASAAAGFSATANPSLRKKMASYQSTNSCRMNLLHKSKQDGHSGGGGGDAFIGKNIQQSIRPVLLSTAVASSILALSLPTAAHADNAFDNDNHLTAIHSESISSTVASSYAPSHYSPSAMMVMPSLELSSSSLANPIGDLEDGSDTSVGTSLGQWFFLLYVVVSLLAGGKEVLSRIQKQMDKEDS
mmetsp:Transcript_27268/g.56854  ORF Transcript_27268/g.56854 Transcript_27268/m.56854 type:complete len:199 (+) Transcript_27268:29-625(+)